jgi:hypothetical protein
VFSGTCPTGLRGAVLRISRQIADNIKWSLKYQRGQQMKNVEMKLDGDIPTIKVDVTKEFGLSASGKTIIIAST